MNQKVESTNKQNQVVKKELPDIGKHMLSNMVEQVVQFSKIEGNPLNNLEKSYASEIALGVFKQVEERKIDWKEIDVKNVVSQIKLYARLGLSISESELYVDIRRNGKTNKFDVNIKKQYQGIEKEMRKWSSKKIVRFAKGVICEGDTFETETDFETGLTKVVKHVKNKDINRNDLKNIVGAYQIAYVDEKGDGKLNQYMVEIDKNRIERAMKASPTSEKPIWKADTQRMVLKTATWSLYNYVMKPFIDVPVELKEDWEKTNEVMNFNSMEEAEIVAQEEIDYHANTGELIDVPEDFEEETVEEPKQEAPQPAVNQAPQTKNYGF